METSADSDALRRRHGLRLTAQRMAVPRAMSDRPHSTADNIYSVVRAEIGDGLASSGLQDPRAAH